MAQSDQFNGRLGLIFASIGAAIGTGNIWRFPRMVGANGGGTFLIPWLIFLFAWSIPLVIAEFAMGKRSRTGTIGTFRLERGKCSSSGHTDQQGFASQLGCFARKSPAGGQHGIQPVLHQGRWAVPV